MYHKFYERGGVGGKRREREKVVERDDDKKTDIQVTWRERLGLRVEATVTSLPLELTDNQRRNRIK